MSKEVTTATIEPGTVKAKRMRAKKTGRIFVYEVYRTVSGDVYTARLVEWAGGTIAKPVWGDPCDTEDAAIKAAFHTFAAPLLAAQERDAEYRRSGGY
ncbi:MAG TPA: hypothetical protein VM529_13545 [Gemmata sp.]|nr:hypothetical protein [Gemmata sp.]